MSAERALYTKEARAHLYVHAVQYVQHAHLSIAVCFHALHFKPA